MPDEGIACYICLLAAKPFCLSLCVKLSTGLTTLCNGMQGSDNLPGDGDLATSILATR